MSSDSGKSSNKLGLAPGQKLWEAPDHEFDEATLRAALDGLSTTFASALSQVEEYGALREQAIQARQSGDGRAAEALEAILQAFDASNLEAQAAIYGYDGAYSRAPGSRDRAAQLEAIVTSSLALAQVERAAELVGESPARKPQD